MEITDGAGLKGFLTRRLRILWQGRTSCRERALKCGRWSRTVILIEGLFYCQGSCIRFQNSAILMLLPLLIFMGHNRSDCLYLL